jgi:hypothetical protein
MNAADPSDPINPACFKNSRRCVKFVLISPPHPVCMNQQSGNSAIQLGRQGAPVPSGSAFRNLDCARHCLIEAH